MKSRTVFTLVGVLVLLTLIALVADRAELKRRRSRLGGGPLLIGFDQNLVTRVEVTVGGTTWTIQNRDGSWWTRALDDNSAGKTGHTADVAAVRATLDALDALDRTRLVSTNAAKHPALGVDDGNAQATVVALWTGRDEPTYRLIVGKTGTDQTSYVRLVDEDDVYASDSLLSRVFARGATGWRDRSIVGVAASEVVGLELTVEDETVAIRRDASAGAWAFVAPEQATTETVDQGTVEFVLRSLTSLEADEFPVAPTHQTTGLPLATDRSTITLGDGSVVELVWSNKRDEKVFVQRTGVDTIYVVAGYKKSSVLKRLDELIAQQSEDAEASTDAAPRSE